MACPDDATLDDLVEGRLDFDALDRIEQHLDECVTCSDLVSLLSGGQLEAAPLLPGSHAGRQIVERRIGQGAMGVVYLARDPELERPVAVKVLRRSASLAAEERLLREARAMARLAHPNVVSIFDVGRVDGRIYLAMEFVEGQTLRAWLAERPRSLAEIRRVFADVAAGLAHAHATGIVHRDFKPDNVLVGRDGRARVTDFGLARAEALSDETDDLEAPASEPHGTRGMLGTPAYMAPEQLRGEVAGPGADQFALAVSFYEAVSGRRPYGGSEPGEILRRMSAEPPPPLGGVSRGIRRAVARALDLDPEARHASVAALGAALAPGKERRSLALAGAALLAVAAAGIAGAHVTRAPAESPCAAGSAKLAAVWGPARHEAVLGAFRASGSPLAEAAARGATSALDRYANGWDKEYRAACEATQTVTALDARMACLDARLSDLGALARTYEAADRTVVEHALEAAFALGPVEDCANASSLGASDPRPRDPDRAARLQELEARLSEAKARGATGRVDLELAPLEAEARALAFRPAQAEVQLLRSSSSRRAADFDVAAKSARAAISLAEGARSERLAARAWLELLAVEGARGRPQEVIANGELGRAALARAGDPPELLVSLLTLVGAAGVATSAFSDAERDLSRALELGERKLGERSLPVARTLTALANLARARGELERARAIGERALSIDRELLGAEHPELASDHHNLAGTLRLAGKHEQALSHYRSALDIEKNALGPRHPRVGLTENSIGLALLDSGKDQDAPAHLHRALEILEARRHPDRALALANLGILDARAGRHAEAARRFASAIEIVRPSAGFDAERVADLFEHRARSLRALGRHADARKDLDEALRIFELHSKQSPSAARRRDALTAELARPKRALAPKPKERLGTGTYGAQTSWETP